MTVEEAKAYFTKLAQDTGLDESQREAVLKAFENDKFARGAADPLMRQDDYSRAQDKVRAREKELTDWYTKAEKAYNANLAGVEQLKQYEQLYGPLNGDSKIGGGTPAGLTQKDLDERIALLSQATVNLFHKGLRMAQDHLHRFGEPLDTQALERYAVENKITDTDLAYDRFVQPKLDAQRQRQDTEREASVAKRIEEAKAEAVRDFASRNKLPIDAGPKPFHPFFDRDAPKEGTSELDQDRASRGAFMEGWDNWKPSAST